MENSLINNDENHTVNNNLAEKISSILANVSNLETAVPDWAKMLLESFRILIAELQSINEGQRTVIQNHEQQMKNMTEAFSARGAVLDAIIADRDRLDMEVTTLRDKVDDLENYSRQFSGKLLHHKYISYKAIW